MRYDFTPIFRSTIGFDQVGRVLDAVLTTQESVPNYPPYDIERTDQNDYRITMALAGFGEKEKKPRTIAINGGSGLKRLARKAA